MLAVDSALSDLVLVLDLGATDAIRRRDHRTLSQQVLRVAVAGLVVAEGMDSTDCSSNLAVVAVAEDHSQQKVAPELDQIGWEIALEPAEAELRVRVCVAEHSRGGFGSGSAEVVVLAALAGKVEAQHQAEVLEVALLRWLLVVDVAVAVDVAAGHFGFLHRFQVPFDDYRA